jgi:hypothetical protein
MSVSGVPEDDAAAERTQAPQVKKRFMSSALRIPLDVERMLAAVKAGSGHPALVYALIQGMRARADRYERDLIQALRWDDQGNVIRTWAQVAELVNAGLGSRQAAHARWSRLTDKPADWRKRPRRGRPRSRAV